MPAPPATVLCVCTANVCRSPAAELLLRAGLRRRLGERVARAIQVGSAGTWASHGRPIEPGTAKALRAHGVSAADVAAARSAPLRREDVVAADLVLGAAAEHVRGVWRLQIAARYRTFTLGELARLLEAVDPAILPPLDGPEPDLPARPGPFWPAAALVSGDPFDDPPVRGDPPEPDPGREVRPSDEPDPDDLGRAGPTETDRTAGYPAGYPADYPAGGPTTGPAARLQAMVRAAGAIREARRTPDTPYLTEAYDLPDPTDNDLAQRDMVEQTAFHVDALLDVLAGPVPSRRVARDKVHWPAWAVQLSRSRPRRGASR